MPVSPPVDTRALPTLEQVEALARARRATRHFKPDPLPAGLLARLLDTARWAPSGYNLQPTHFVVVDDPALKPALSAACLGQRQVKEAAACVVFVGDARVVERHFQRVLAMDREAGAISAEYEALLRRVVPLAFRTGPLGLNWLWKAALIPAARCVRPLPEIPAVHRRFWLCKQAMLAAMTFMLAARSAGLATAPMEGFDEGRVKRLLRIPAANCVPVVVAAGYAADETLRKTRLPLEGLIHQNGWR